MTLCDKCNLIHPEGRCPVEMPERIAELEESLHYCNGVADLAMKHRDAAEADCAAMRAVVVELMQRSAVVNVLTDEQLDKYEAILRTDHPGGKLLGEGTG